MARYLTPPKIAILALITLYSDSRVPTSSTISILSFIVAQLIPLDPAATTDDPADSTPPTLLTIDDLQKATITHPSVIPGRTLWDLLLKTLWDFNSFDALDVFFTNLSTHLVKTRHQDHNHDEDQGAVPPLDGRTLISRTSPLGTFIRRAQLEFTRLQFHDAVALWKSFVTYRDPTLPTWKKRNPSAGSTAFDTNIKGWHDPLTTVVYRDLPDLRSEGAVSTDDVEKLLEWQVEQMQKMGDRIPESARIQFRTMLESNATVPSLSHYAKFLDSWRAGHYPSSFDNLHRYFDYTMHNRDRTFYQYALLNLAILQADFACFTEAVAAMQEAMATARENKDMACLNFSLSWLYHFTKAHPQLNYPGNISLLGGSGVVEREGLAFLRTKAKETSMWSLWTTSLLSEARLAMEHGDSVPLVFENITKSSHLNVTKNMTNAVGPLMLLKSALWTRLGNTHLAWSCCDVFLNCYANQSPHEDVLRCICRSAYIMAQKGRYVEAFAMMEQVDAHSLRTLKAHQYWATILGVLKLIRQLHRNNLSSAERLITQLLSPEPSDPDVAFEVHLLRIDLLMRYGSRSDALSELEKVAAALHDQSADVYQRIRLWTLKAILLADCERPLMGLSVALRAAKSAQRAKLIPAFCHAMAVVSNLLTNLKEFDAATQLLGSIMSRIIETEDPAMIAQSYSFLADAHMGQAGTASSPRRKEFLNKALESINCAFAEYCHVEDIKGQCEMMAKKATIMHLLADVVLANDCATNYLELKKGFDGVLE